MNFDIVVVGAGASGISAALTASECGAKVALLEKATNLAVQGCLVPRDYLRLKAGLKKKLE